MYDEDFALKRVKDAERAYDEERKNEKISTTGEETYDTTRYVPTRQTRGYIKLRITLWRPILKDVSTI